MNKFTVYIILLALISFSACTKKESNVTAKSETKDSVSVKVKDTLPDKKESLAGIFDMKKDISEYKSQLKFEGKIQNSIQWKDKTGLNLIILTTTDEIKGKSKTGIEDYSLSKKLFGYHFVKNGDTFTELWKIQDFVDNCDFDLTLEFLENSLTITDLDNNGIAESSFLYKMACRSDVSPCEMKLIMHEGKTKYAIRGEMLVEIPETNEKYGDKMTPDKSFDSAPKTFLDYAKNEWNKYKKEKFN